MCSRLHIGTHIMPHQPDLQPFLNRLTRRSVLSATEQQAILNLPTHAAQVRANHDFVRLGEVVSHACVIVDGIAGRFGQNADGERQITALHIAGDAADLHSVVQPKSASALQALSTVTLVRVPHQALRAIAGQYPAIAEAFWRDCVVDASVISQWVVNVGRRDAKVRIAHLLCEMAVRYQIDVQSDAILFEFPLTQVHIADATGLTSVHVNRTLMSLRDDGVVFLAQRMVHILDWAGLARLGEFDAGYLQNGTEPEERLSLAAAAE